MIAKHNFEIHAVCPVNGDRDTYRCEVTLNRLVHCEQLIADAAVFADVTIYQEDLTESLAVKWQATVRTVGNHVGGLVETEVIAFPKSLVSINPYGEHK